MKIIEKDDGRYWKTSSFNTSAYLLCKGFELVNITPLDNPKKKEFVFCDRPEREQVLHNFSFSGEDDPEVMVDARKLILCIRVLKEKLYSNQF